MAGETLIYLLVFALIVAGAAALFGFLLVRQAKILWRSLHRLRDKIDGTTRWP